MKKIYWPVLVLAALAVGGCRFPGFGNSLKLSGTLEFTEYSVGAPVPGRLAKLTIHEGDFVKQGELVAALEHFDQAARDYERAKELYQSGGADKQTLEKLEIAMNDQRIISPVDGVVLVKVREIGEVLGAGSPVAVIGSRKEVWVKVYVTEGEISRVRMNDAATLKFDGIEKKFKGHVIFISPRAEFTPRNVQTAEERITQTFGVKVALDEIEDNLRPGVAADVTLELKD